MVENLRRKFEVHRASLYLQYWGIGHTLKPEGKPHWEKLLWKIENGEQITPSEEIGIVNGFNRKVEGMDKLESISREKGFLVISNHSKEGPVQGWGQFFVINHAVKQTTGREIVWAQGSGSYGASDLVSEITETIKVGSGRGIEGVKEIFYSMQTKPVGIFAEGTQKKNLKRGDYRAGKIIARAVKHDIPVVCIASSFVNGEISISADILDPLEVKRLETQDDKVNMHQEIVDYAMTTIASHLPENRRGVYTKAVQERLTRQTAQEQVIFDAKVSKQPTH